LIKEVRNIYEVAGFKTASEFLWHLIKNSLRVIRDRSLISVDQAMHKANYEFHIGDQLIQLPRNSFGIAREIIGRKIYELDNRFKIHSGDFVIDLGANIGVFSMAAAAQGANVLAIEAQSGFIAEMAVLLRMNKIETVSPLHGIVAPTGGAFSSTKVRKSASHWKNEPPEINLNQALQDIKWSRVDFLKADVEGAEFELFANNDEWLAKVRRIAMEIHAEYGDVDRFVSRLKAKGFEVILTDLEKTPVSFLSQGMGYVYALRP
jgi:FkbM family methyltransferase